MGDYEWDRSMWWFTHTTANHTHNLIIDDRLLTSPLLLRDILRLMRTHKHCRLYRPPLLNKVFHMWIYLEDHQLWKLWKVGLKAQLVDNKTISLTACTSWNLLWKCVIFFKYSQCEAVGHTKINKVLSSWSKLIACVLYLVFHNFF